MRPLFSARHLAILIAFAVGLLLSISARPAAAQSCPTSTAVVRWTPARGPVARFVADSFFANAETGLWIGLGRADGVFWSAEGGRPNDACDDCEALSLVETRLDGSRKRHPIASSSDWARIGDDPAARKAFVLGRLWALAHTTWPAERLGQGYTLTLGRSPAPASSSPLSAFEVTDAADLHLRYRLTASTQMCWCFYEWKASDVTIK